MKIPIAKNKCMKCSYQWEDQPGTRAKIHSCPSCGSIYWEWINFDESYEKQNTKEVFELPNIKQYHEGKK